MTEDEQITSDDRVGVETVDNHATTYILARSLAPEEERNFPSGSFWLLALPID